MKGKTVLFLVLGVIAFATKKAWLPHVKGLLEKFKKKGEPLNLGNQEG